MRKFLLSSAAAFAVLAATVAALPSLTQAQPYYGGMMGGYGGYGMMGPGYNNGMMGPGYNNGMMGPGYNNGMMGPGYNNGMMGPGYNNGMMGNGPGWNMHGWGGMGPGMMYGHGPGYSGQGNLNLTIDQVKTYLQHMIRNPNLMIGEIREKDADTITADIVTKQGSQLVQRLEFDRHNGFVQPEQ